MSVGLSVLTAKMAEPVEMPFEMWTQVGLWNVLDGVQVAQGKGHF